MIFVPDKLEAIEKSETFSRADKLFGFGSGGEMFRTQETYFNDFRFIHARSDEAANIVNFRDETTRGVRVINKKAFQTR